jgi:N-acetylglucosaminyldiphosphoundecaprenol N-acetyl-beta-D-mannosaminyltransferase
MKTIDLLGTPLQATCHEEWIAFCKRRAKEAGAVAIDFTNTHIVALRRTDSKFRQLTDAMDYFVPDSMPLKWCLNFRGAGMLDRLYGPDFLPRCVAASPRPFTHYFLVGSDACLAGLRTKMEAIQPELDSVGWRNGYFSPDESPAIVDEINERSPDFIWVGLGTPKQQEWIHQWKPGIRRGLLLAVGFAFDANAGTKQDSPRWMQKTGLGWLFRLLREPGRLGPRYLKYNSLFLWMLLCDAVRGAIPPAEPGKHKGT